MEKSRCLNTHYVRTVCIVLVRVQTRKGPGRRPAEHTGTGTGRGGSALRARGQGPPELLLLLRPFVSSCHQTMTCPNVKSVSGLFACPLFIHKSSTGNFQCFGATHGHDLRNYLCPRRGPSLHSTSRSHRFVAPESVLCLSRDARTDGCPHSACALRTSLVTHPEPHSLQSRHLPRHLPSLERTSSLHTLQCTVDHSAPTRAPVTLLPLLGLPLPLPPLPLPPTPCSV